MLRLTPVEAARMLGSKPAVRAASSARKKSQASALASKAALALAGLPPYTTEFRFHPTRRWRLDYAWPAAKVAMELHGGVHNQGRHTRGKGFVEDREKMNEAALLGWRVIEVTPEHIKNGSARQWLERLLTTNEDQDHDGDDQRDV